MDNQAIIQTIRHYYPDVVAVYVFGSSITDMMRPDSDVDIAILLPPEVAQRAGDLTLSPCQSALEEILRKKVDLVNARLVSTVFQKEILRGGHRIFCSDTSEPDEFEMLTLSYYQKLNEERGEILMAFENSGRAYNL